MGSFSIPAGELDLELESSGSSTDSATGEIQIDLDPDSSDTATALSFEVDSSSDDVEITSILLTSSQEIQKMKEEERYGHFYRVQDRQDQIQARLRGVFEQIAAETPEARRVRRQSFQRAVFGLHQ